MGAKHAGVHVRCNDSARILAVLEKEFGRKIGPEKEDLAAMEMIAAVAKKNINSIADSGEKSQKEAMLSRLMLQTQQEMREGEPAVVVVREHFVSIYWYDHIRVENLCPQTSKYSALCGVPAMGVGVYDDTNFCCIRWHRKRVREIEGIDKVKLYPAVCLRNSIVINVGTCCSAI